MTRVVLVYTIQEQGSYCKNYCFSDLAFKQGRLFLAKFMRQSYD